MPVWNLTACRVLVSLIVGAVAAGSLGQGPTHATTPELQAEPIQPARRALPGGQSKGTAPRADGGGISGVVCVQPPGNCQPPEQVNGLTSTGAYSGPNFVGAFRVADDFSPAFSGNITNVCWWGMYGNGGADCVPLPADAFTIRIYANNAGRPSTTLLGTFSQGTNLSVTRSPAGSVGALTEYEYSATLSGALVNAAAGTCYWIEITNNPGGCTWYWETGTGAGSYAAAAQDADNSYGLVDITNSNLAVCLNVGLSDPTAAPCAVVGTGSNAIVDACAALILNVPANGTPQLVDLRGTQNEVGDPDLCPLETPGPGGVGSAWARFVATSASHQISTCSNVGSDSLLAVYSGSCGALTQLACNDDAACGDTGLLSQVCVSGLTVGSTYYVQLRAFDDAARGVYNLTVGGCQDCQAHQPTGGYLIIPSITGVVSCWDDFRPCKAGSLSSMTLRGSFWNGVSGAGSLAVEPNPATEVITLQVWAQGLNGVPDLMIAQRDTISANLTLSSRIDSGLFFNTDGISGFDESTDAELIDWSLSFPTIALTGNICYWITVQNETLGPNGEGFRWLAGRLVNMTAGNDRCAFDDENDGVQANDLLNDDCIFCLDVELDPSVPCSNLQPPSNDTCETAQIVPCTGGAGVQYEVFINGDEYPGDPPYSCFGNQQGFGTVWYRITTGNAPASLLIDTCLTNFIGTNDSLLAAYTGPDCANLTEVACADDGCGEAAAYEEIRIDPALPNTAYWIQLAGEDAFAELGYTIRFRCPAPPPPANDTCANADPLVIGVPEQGSTLNATYDANAAAAGVCAGVTVGPRGVWHAVVNSGPATTLSANLCTLTAIDTQVSIFCGADCSNLTCVAADDDGCGPVGGASSVTWCAKQGAVYWVYVHNFPGENGGTYEIVINNLGGSCAPAVNCPVAPTCPGAKGDTNCSGGVPDFFDIDPFLLALFNLPAYQFSFCGGSICAADVDCSGNIDFFDIDPFLQCLFLVCPPCPGPIAPPRPVPGIGSGWWAMPRGLVGALTPIQPAPARARSTESAYGLSGAYAARTATELYPPVPQPPKAGDPGEIADGGGCDGGGGDPTGGCCLPPRGSNNCIILTEGNCAAQGGLYRGDNTTCAGQPCLVANDTCDDADALILNTTELGSSFNAANEPPGVPSPCGPPVEGPGVWHLFLGTGRNIRIETCGPGTSFDTRLSVYCNFCNGLTCVGGDDDGCGIPGGPSRFDFCAKAGITYLVLVHAPAGSPGGAYAITLTDLGGACTPAPGCASGGTGGGSGGSTAVSPIDPAYFTVDRGSIPGYPFGAADVLRLQSGAISIAFTSANLGLTNPNDELTAGSFVAPITTFGADSFLLRFSVDRNTVGLADPDPELLDLGLPYNVKDQAARGQQAGDEYLSSLLFERTGPVIGQDFAANNTLARNQSDAGGVDYLLRPVSTPDEVNGGTQDNFGTGAVPRVVINDGTRFYFCVAGDSPSLAGLPPPQSGATVYDDQPLLPGNPGATVFAAPSAYGLQEPPIADEVDALIVFDNGDGVFNANVDQILFSLAPGSPSLGGGTFSPADILTSTPGGSFAVFASAADLGLRPSDNIDALDFEPCLAAGICIQDKGVGYAPCPFERGDSNCSGAVDFFDISPFLDALFNREAYLATTCNGALCTNDVNCDGAVDSFDIDPFVTCIGGTCPPCPP